MREISIVVGKKSRGSLFHFVMRNHYRLMEKFKGKRIDDSWMRKENHQKAL